MLAALVGAKASDASTRTAESLLIVCSNENDLGWVAGCEGYIFGSVETWIEASGAASVLWLWSSGEKERVRKTVVGFCIPTRMSVKQLTQIVVKYIKANPEEWHEPASYMVREALSNTFPCED
ncbi:MAG: Rap1a/Tai family immunity protein [Pseudomonadota bacterium]